MKNKEIFAFKAEHIHSLRNLKHIHHIMKIIKKNQIFLIKMIFFKKSIFAFSCGQGK
ncbi:Uncharacterized protein APZ42_024443 [Daphnia magna]|uniref:Uncharacterized protein n=1 Tax=Daphnia magna TaxID=35525 RepID=A0A164U1D8_9CRUS|nr:Uncharacterized protein APZ42_024443 [Daphnia magna]